LTSSGETYPSEENYVKYEIGPQFEYGYRDGAVIVKFRTGPFNVTAYLYEARLEDRDEETDILAERLEFKRRIENLNRSLQEWSPEEYYDFVQEHSPAAIRNKSEKRKRPPNPWAGMSLEECMVFLNDKALEDSI